MPRPFEPLENVERTALVLIKKQPFMDWLATHGVKEDISLILQDPDIYLLPDFETPSEMESWLKKNYDQLFCDQMFQWFIDESYWVPNRSFALFKEWFSYSLHTMVWDTETQPIEKN